MKKVTVLLIFILSIGLTATHYFLHPPIKQRTPEQMVTLITTKQIRQSESETERHFLEKIKTITAVNDVLHQELQHSQTVLLQTGFQVKQLQLSIRGLINRDVAADVPQQLLVCDSLKQQTETLITQTILKDSLYEHSIGLLQQEVRNKDSIIILDSQQYVSLKGLLNQSLQQQELLATDNKHLLQSVSRKKVANRLLASSLLVLTGITTTLFIQQQL